jgi:type II secretory pathway component PulF
MPAFEYKAVTNTGGIVVETVESANEQSLMRELFLKGFRPVSIKMKKAVKAETAGGGMALFAKKINTEEIVLFTRQLVTLLRAGVPMLTALEALTDQTSKQLGEVVNKIYVDVMSGNSLSQALDKHPKVFNKLFVNSVHAGEMSGSLDDVLERMVTVLKHDEETKKKVKAALRYPIIVISAMIAAFGVIMTLVVPKFAAMFGSMNMELPLPTKILMGASGVFQHYGLIIGVVVGAILLGFRWYTHTPAGLMWWDETKTKLPLVGPLISKSAMARFTKMFETLNKSGLPILQTLNTVSMAVGNKAIEKTIQQVAAGVERGEGIAGSMKKFELFPPMVVRMIAIGEQSGSLDEMLGSVAEHYDVEVEYAIKGLTSMIEPIITVFLGGAVVIMAFGIFLPMWNMTEMVK